MLNNSKMLFLWTAFVPIVHRHFRFNKMADVIRQ